MYVVAALIVGVVLGVVIQSRISHSKSANLMTQPSLAPTIMEMMKHEQIEVDKAVAPTVKLEVEKDAKGGYNLHLITTNYTFSPEEANKEHVDNHGHGHLYVNGVMMSRLYGEWFHIRELSHGKNQIKVTLNNNNHKEYAVDGQSIQDIVEVDVTDGDTTPHTH